MKRKKTPPKWVEPDHYKSPLTRSLALYMRREYNLAERQKRVKLVTRALRGLRARPDLPGEHEAAGERDLWCAVVCRAIEDLPPHREADLEFFFDGRCEWIAATFGSSAADVRDLLSRAGLLPRRIIQEAYRGKPA